MPSNTTPLSTLLKATDLLAQKDPTTLLSSEDRLAILGFPVAHSLSPAIQNAALKAAPLPYRYIPIEVTPEELAPTLQQLARLGFLGLNITIPHKQAILQHLDEISDHARFLGAVNTISIRDEKLFGYNTDGPGLVTALKEIWGLLLPAQRILILGASGGAGHAIAAQCVLEGCLELSLASRTPSILESQVKRLSQYSKNTIPVKAVELTEKGLSSVMPHVDLIVNATPVGMKESDPPLIPPQLFSRDHYCYDIVYSSATTPLMKSAIRAGAQSANGLSMLLYQGSLAFQIWFEQDPPLDAMRQGLLDAK
ncbi:MAG: shikimate dehydrogenase [Chthoniobacterales bacterium]